MSFIQNLYTSRDNNAVGNTYVGQQDRIWWNPDTNAFYYSDGNTAGGLPVGVGGGNITVNNITANSANISGNIVVAGNISPAGVNKIGGIVPGPGANVSNTGLLTIDTAGLPLSFGDFTANGGLLTLVNNDENMTLQTLGNAEIQLVGNIGFYKPDGYPPNISNRFAFFNNDGQATFYIPVTDPLAGAFKIIGSQGGNFTPPLNTGVMIQITGQNAVPSRIYNDSIGSFAAFVGRRINGNVESPSAVQAGDELIRISSTGYNGTEIPGDASARIVFQAQENYTPTARGSNLSFYATAVGSNVLTQIANLSVANGVYATKFTTADGMTATGNITGGNILTGGLISATGNVTGSRFIGNGAPLTTLTGANVSGTVANANSSTNLDSARSFLVGQVAVPSQTFPKNTPTLTANVTVTGLTTSHHIVATAANAQTTGTFVTAAFPAAANTMSIQIQNTTGGAVTTVGFDLTYWAWI